MTDSAHTLRETPVRTQADLERLWRSLMEPLGFSSGSLWLLYIGADSLPFPHITQVQDVEEVPDASGFAGFVHVLQELGDDLGGGGRWAFLRSRPGRGGPDALDRALAVAVLDACRAAGVPTEVMHLATDDRLVPLPYDELAVSA